MEAQQIAMRDATLKYSEFLQNVLKMNGSVLDLHIHNIMMYFGALSVTDLQHIAERLEEALYD